MILIPYVSDGSNQLIIGGQQKGWVDRLNALDFLYAGRGEPGMVGMDLKSLAHTDCPFLLDCNYNVTTTTKSYPTNPNIFQHDRAECLIRNGLKMVGNRHKSFSDS